MTSGSFILKLIGTNHGRIKGVIGNYLSGLEVIDKTLCIGCTKLYPDAIKFRTFSNIKTILTKFLGGKAKYESIVSNLEIELSEGTIDVELKDGRTFSFLMIDKNDALSEYNSMRIHFEKSILNVYDRETTHTKVKTIPVLEYDVSRIKPTEVNINSKSLSAYLKDAKKRNIAVKLA